jgi:uncharacterized integral membrane protein
MTADAVELTVTGGQQFMAVFVVILFSVLGGILVQILLKGIDF